MSEARRPPPPMPVSVITGFLGAGKTTLLNRLLRDVALADTVVIINEFGEIGLDHLLIEKIDGNLVLLQSGCLCCTMRGDLITTLEDLLRRRDNGRMPPFTRVLIETTGLADPAPVLHTLMSHPYLLLRYRLEGIITLVDAVNGSASLDAYPEAVKQAAMADRLVLTKTDLVSDGTAFAALRARLSALNPFALQLDAARGEANAACLLDAGPFDPERKTMNVRRWLNAEAMAPDAAHHGHAHDVNRHDAHIRAFCLRSRVALAPAGFELFLHLLREAHGPALLRVKGLVALSDDRLRPLVIHGVQHVFHPPVRLERWPDADHSTRIVFILRDLDASFIERFWAAFAGTIAPDQPDALALSHNPLKPQPGGLLA